MDLIADLLLIAAAVGAAFYCFALSRRLKSLGSSETEFGSAINALSEQVTRLEQAIQASQNNATQIEDRLKVAFERAEALEALLKKEVSPTAVKTPAPAAYRPENSEARPAAFRRRLFTEVTTEGKR